MDIKRLAAFSMDGTGGNPAGVMLLDAPLPEADMARIAADVGYSETAFAVPQNAAQRSWRVRYFSPAAEVPFCGHATSALGAVLAQTVGAGRFDLTLNDAEISVEGAERDGQMMATLASPPTQSGALAPGDLAAILALFGLEAGDLDSRLPAARIHGGADHAGLPLRDRARLAAMDYDLGDGRTLMRQLGLVTIMLVHILEDRVFAARNAFAAGGVLEDPATGAAAAAFAGFLRDQGWPHGGSFTIRQGEDMGAPSRIEVTLSDVVGAPVRITGATRAIA